MKQRLPRGTKGYARYDHPGVWLSHHGRKVRIDREIVPLVKATWALGIETFSSCQAAVRFDVFIDPLYPDGPGDLLRVHLSFPSTLDLRRWLTAVDPTFQWIEVMDICARPDQWGNPNARPIDLLCHVFFHRGRLPQVVEALRKAKAA